MFSELRSEGAEFTTLWVNCRRKKSSYQVAISIVNEMRVRDEKMAKTGHSSDDVYESLYEELENVGGDILIVLDEIDAIGVDDDFLYELPRAKSNGNIEDVNIGVIGISNDYDFREALSPQVKDTLCEKEITFTAYDAEELSTILQDRVEKAFVDGVVDDGAVELASALAAKDSGSARQALDLMREAGDLAAGQDGDVTTDLVNEAVGETERANKVQSIKDQTTSAQYALLSVTLLQQQEQQTNSTTLVHKRYERIAEMNGHDPVSSRSLHDRLDDLAMMGFIEKEYENKGGNSGRRSIYSTDLSVDLVVDAVGDIAYPSSE